MAFLKNFCLALILSTTLSAVSGSPAECVTESGFDYVGNDLVHLAAVNVFECCHQCQEFAKRGCRAYSWTEHDGGTCWLKSGRGSIAVAPSVKSGVIAAFRFAAVCQLEHGIDFVGNDMGSVRVDDAGGCCEVCEQLPSCRAATFTVHDGGTCWLKSAKGEMVVNPDAVSSLPYVEDPTCGIEDDVDFVGNDIGNTQASDPHDCCALCEAFGGCRAFTWTDHEGGTCWFKNRKGEVAWETGVKSGQVLANPPAPSCALELNVEYSGKVVGNASSPNAYGCCSICMRTAGCAAFSWNDLDGGTCYLKSSKGDRQVSSRFVSAVV